MTISWTPDQNALLRKHWSTGENLKTLLHLFGNRSYKAVVSHAKKQLKLGPRPKTARGVPGYAWDWIKAELERGGSGTAPELVKRTGLTTAPVCKELKNANPGPDGEVHIVEWRRRSTGGEPVAVYAIGPGENAVKPANLTIAEKNQLARERKQHRANPFATAMHQVIGNQFKHTPRGRYASRVIQMEAA